MLKSCQTFGEFKMKLYENVRTEPLAPQLTYQSIIIKRYEGQLELVRPKVNMISMVAILMQVTTFTTYLSKSKHNLSL